jgi:predicted ATPase
LPADGADLIGRDAALQQLRDLLSAYRIVTLTGPGGIGKTSLVLKVAHRVLGEFADGGWLVELASLSDSGLVPSTVAHVLRLGLGGGDPTAETVARAISDRHLLLILDNCEHLIDAVAILAEMLLRLCPRVTILMTSREVLRIQGEYVYRVPPLVVPAPGEKAASEILGHSAPELFIARATELGSDFSSNVTNLVTIAAICRHLDGIPLAIEFAAARAATLGIELVATGLHDRLALLTSGRRTALPRHKTLRAALDWSYELLPEAERLMLCRLAVFPSGFTLDGAVAVIKDAGLDLSAVTDGIANLVAKSLIMLDKSERGNRWYLLETIRAYALKKLTEDGEAETAARQHATYFRDLFTPLASGARSSLSDQDLARCVVEIDNIRAALEWCFGARGNTDIGVGLAAAAAPVFLAMSLLPECHRWSEHAIFALDDAARGGLDEMHLQAALGVSSMFVRGGRDAARAALERSLAIAEERGDVLDQMRLLAPLNMFHLRAGNFATALEYARRGFGAIGTVENSVAVSVAHHLLGISLHLSGDLAGARVELEAALDRGPRSLRTSVAYLGFENKTLANAIVARNLWLQGYPDEAIESARKAVEEASAADHALTLAIVSIWAISVFLWTGELQRAIASIDMLISHAESHSLAPYLLVARGFKSEVAIRQGDANGGVESLQDCLQRLHATPYELLTTELNLSLAWGLSAIGQVDEAISLIDESLAQVETNGNLVYIPELLRTKGVILLLLPGPSRNNAEACLRQALELSRHQGARAWELRAATDLANLLASRGDIGGAHELLRPVFEHFVEGLGTADLKAAERLLAMLR